MLTPARTGDAEFIAARIPHHGRMRLLDRLLDWDERSIRCACDSHRAPDHPLRTADRLGAACALEYAAQAMALHSVLTAGERGAPRAGRLIAVREMQLHAERLDTLAAPLIVDCRRIEASSDTLLYAFDVSCDDAPVAAGRALIVHEAP